MASAMGTNSSGRDGYTTVAVELAQARPKQSSSHDHVEDTQRMQQVLEQEARAENAARRIQCAIRSALARRETTRRRFEIRVNALAAEVEKEQSAEPTDIIKSLFWAMQAAKGRKKMEDELCKEARREEAAVKIQKTWKMSTAVKELKTRLPQIERHRAAETIQGIWRAHDGRMQQLRGEQKIVASIKIQAYIRRFLVMYQMRRRKKERETVKRSQYEAAVALEETRDRSAIKIQCLVRIVLAKNYANWVREEKHKVVAVQLRNEAAKLIQKLVRCFLACRKVDRMREERRRRGGSSTTSAATLALCPKPPTPTPVRAAVAPTRSQHAATAPRPDADTV